MEPELTLARVVTLARQSECVKTQQPTFRGELSQESTIEVIRGDKTLSKVQNRIPQVQKNLPPSQKEKKCGRCERPGSHNRAQCSARDAICHKCGKTEHFKSVCRSTSTR